MQLENVCADITRGISDIGKKLPHIEKVPHVDNEASRDIEKNLAHVDSVSRELRENPFELLFSPLDMHEEKKDVLFSHPDMHPPSIVYTFSAFVPKQGALIRNPASAVDKDDTVQRTAVAGREDMARHPEDLRCPHATEGPSHRMRRVGRSFWHSTFFFAPGRQAAPGLLSETDGELNKRRREVPLTSSPSRFANGPALRHAAWMRGFHVPAPCRKVPQD